MKQQMKFDEEVVVHKLAIYMFLQKFYDGQLNRIGKASWKELIDVLTQEMTIFSNDEIGKGLQLLSQFTDEDIEELEFEFNRLFVGPNQLVVSPYESTYRNTERVIMQSETIAVRRFYEKAGLVLAKKNINPDDHIALELEFVCYLLENSLEDETHYEFYQEFLKAHLFHWIEAHCALILENSENKIVKGVSTILQGLIKEEKVLMEVNKDD